MNSGDDWSFDLGSILAVEAIDEFSGGTIGGRLKQWILGAILPICMISFANHGLLTGATDTFALLELILEDNYDAPAMKGLPGICLAIVTAAAGGFLHYHYFWGISASLWRYNYLPKLLCLWVSISSLGYALYRAVF